MSALKEYSEKLTTIKTEAVKEQINEVANELLLVENAKLLESVFVEYFLDHFKSGQNDIHSALTLKWIELAGSPFNEVDIVDDNGNIIYSVPPIMARPNIDEAVENMDFNNIMATYQLKKNNIAALGANYINTQLNNVGKNIKADNKNIYTERWLSIFNRYIEQEEHIDSVPKIKINTSLDTMIDYD